MRRGGWRLTVILICPTPGISCVDFRTPTPETNSHPTFQSGKFAACMLKTQKSLQPFLKGFPKDDLGLFSKILSQMWCCVYEFSRKTTCKVCACFLSVGWVDVVWGGRIFTQCDLILIWIGECGMEVGGIEHRGAIAIR